MKLYLLYKCPFGHRASFTLQEKQLSFEPQFFQQGKRPPEMEAVGPYAKSPTLFDGDSRVWNAQIVLEYLEDRYPERPLLPASAGERAQVRMLTARIGAELESKLGTVAVETRYKPQKDEAKVAEATRDFLAALGSWDRRLDGRAFLVGDTLTLADITLFTIFPAIKDLAGVEIPREHAHLRAWFDRIAARPAAALLQPAV
jgi:glutathione S-transferase